MTQNLADSTKQALAGCAQAVDPADSNLVEWECPSCLNVAFRTTVLTDPCEHVFHRQCLEDCLGRHPKRTCPSCRRDLAPGQGYKSASRPVRCMLALAKVICPQGCAAEVSFEDLERHIQGCPRTPMTCVNDGCGEGFLRLHREEHEGSCPHRMVACIECGKKVKFNERQQHLSDCCEVTCDGCGKKVLHKVKHDHDISQCAGPAKRFEVNRLLHKLRQRQGAVEKQRKAEREAEALAKKVAEQAKRIAALEAAAALPPPPMPPWMAPMCTAPQPPEQPEGPPCPVPGMPPPPAGAAETPGPPPLKFRVVRR